MAESKQQRGFEDQEDETRFQSGQASFILVVIRQIRETATVLSESNTTEEIDLAGNIVRMSRTLEDYVQSGQRRATTKEQKPFEYSKIIRKMKKKRKLTYYYFFKNKRITEIYKESYNKNEITVPKHLVPRHHPEETKQEFQLRTKHARQRLRQEMELSESKKNTYEKRIKKIDERINDLIEMKYGDYPLKMHSIRNQWKTECEKEEVKSEQIWQVNETKMKSKMRTFKIPPDSVMEKLDQENRDVKKTASKKKVTTKHHLKEKKYKVCPDNTISNIRELESEYIKEFEKMMHAEENGEFFDKSALEKIGADIDKLEKVLGTTTNNYDCNRNDDNNIQYRFKETDIKAKPRTKIPMPIKLTKLAKARRKLNLTSDEYN